MKLPSGTVCGAVCWLHLPKKSAILFVFYASTFALPAFFPRLKIRPKPGNRSRRVNSEHFLLFSPRRHHRSSRRRTRPHRRRRRATPLPPPRTRPRSSRRRHRRSSPRRRPRTRPS